MKLFSVVDTATENIENVIMSLGLLIISLIVFVNVIFRYCFNISFAWSEELSRYIVVWITFFGISSCARYGAHVNVDLLGRKLKGKANLILKMAITFVCLVTSAYMTYISALFTITQYQGGNTSIAIAIPIWLIYLSTILGFGFMSYVYLRKLMELYANRGREEEETEC